MTDAAGPLPRDAAAEEKLHPRGGPARAASRSSAVDVRGEPPSPRDGPRGLRRRPGAVGLDRQGGLCRGVPRIAQRAGRQWAGGHPGLPGQVPDVAPPRGGRPRRPPVRHGLRPRGPPTSSRSSAGTPSSSSRRWGRGAGCWPRSTTATPWRPSSSTRTSWGRLRRRPFTSRSSSASRGRDIRAFGADRETIGAISRKSEHWITNTARGGNEAGLRSTPELSALCRRAADAVGRGLLAVDIFESRARAPRQRSQPHHGIPELRGADRRQHLRCDRRPLPPPINSARRRLPPPARRLPELGFDRRWLGIRRRGAPSSSPLPSGRPDRPGDERRPSPAAATLRPSQPPRADDADVRPARGPRGMRRPLPRPAQRRVHESHGQLGPGRKDHRPRRRFPAGAPSWESWYGTPMPPPASIPFHARHPRDLCRPDPGGPLAGPGCEAIVSILCLYPVTSRLHPARARDRRRQDGELADRPGAIRILPPSGAGRRRPLLQADRPPPRSRDRAGPPGATPGTPSPFGHGGRDGPGHPRDDPRLPPRPGHGEREVWQAFRSAYAGQPFVRIVKQTRASIAIPSPRSSPGRTSARSGSRRRSARTAWWSSAPSTISSRERPATRSNA